MRYFSELRDYCKNNLSKGILFPVVGDLKFQVYNKPISEFNISIKEQEIPVIKFVESGDDSFRVAVACDDGTSIQHANTKVVCMKDKIDTLLDLFPNYKNIKIIVGELIKI